MNSIVKYSQKILDTVSIREQIGANNSEDSMIQ